MVKKTKEVVGETENNEETNVIPNTEQEDNLEAPKAEPVTVEGRRDGNGALII